MAHHTSRVARARTILAAAVLLQGWRPGVASDGAVLMLNVPAARACHAALVGPRSAVTARHCIEGARLDEIEVISVAHPAIRESVVGACWPVSSQALFDPRSDLAILILAKAPPLASFGWPSEGHGKPARLVIARARLDPGDWPL